MNAEEFGREICSWDRAALDHWLVCVDSNIEDLLRKRDMVSHEIRYRDDFGHKPLARSKTAPAVRASGFWADLANLLTFGRIWRKPRS